MIDLIDKSYENRAFLIALGNEGSDSSSEF